MSTETMLMLKSKVARLEADNARLQAEAELYEMMAHDLASEPLIAAICKKFPEIAAQWAAYPNSLVVDDPGGSHSPTPETQAAAGSHSMRGAA